MSAHSAAAGRRVEGLPANARGEVSPRAMPGWDGYQRHLLEEEGVVFDSRGSIDLDRFRWEPARSRKR